MPSLTLGLVYDLLGSYPREPGDPADVDAEYEPEETVLLLERAIERLGHRPVRVGNPHALLDRIGKGELPALDAALNLAEGFGGRNREAWAPVLLEMAGIPALGSDALSLSASLDKVWARTLASAAGVPCAAQASALSAEEALAMELPAPFPLFVKPRWEGTSKGIRSTSRVEDREALGREVERIVRDYAQPAVVEAFVGGPEYTVTVVGTPPRALPVLQRALEESTGIGLHALAGEEPPPGGFRHQLPGALSTALESHLGALALRAHAAFDCLDFSRSDFRLDAGGEALFLEINPLPTFAEDGSFGILAELEGRDADALLADVLGEALQRVGLA
jgi:D-alanine-D-alanine ligase